MTTKIGDEAKLAELILYVSQKCASDPTFGSVKLNKILYFSDFIAFGSWGEPITGVEYQHLMKGPAPRRLVPVRDELIARSELVLQRIALASGNFQQKPVNLREANLDEFTAKEICLVDKVIDALWGLGADDTSDLSHRYVGWKMTKENENIPYGSIFISDEPLTEAEIIRGQQLAREFGLTVKTI